jgi:hypothetical protein
MKDNKKLKKFVEFLLKNGDIDDYDYVKELSKEEFEDLVYTWMQDKEIIEMFKECE